MGLMQRAVETYDCHRDFAGRVEENKTPLAPVGHTVTSAQIEITVDSDGRFVSASAVDKESPKVIIPVTEESAARQGTTARENPHPLCDKLKYLTDEPNYYIPQLERWASSQYSHPKLTPILKYVKGGTVTSDLERSGLIKRDSGGKVKNDGDFVVWRVIGLEDGAKPACWMDKTLFDAFERYITNTVSDRDDVFCMINGELTPPAVSHAKGVIAISGNAKLISSNDTSNFTFRGRFTDDSQAATVSYEASQKAHNALRWLAAEQGVVFGGRTFLCWNPKGKKVCGAVRPFRKSSEVKIKPSDYKAELKRTLEGYRTELPDNENVVIAVFDAATSGRLSLTYYNELLGSDFLQRLYEWDLSCAWPNGPFGIQSPPLYQIVNCAYGVQRTENNKAILKTDDKIMRQQMQRMMSCRVDRARVQQDLVNVLVNRASTPQAYDESVWRRIVFTACAVLNKYIADQKGMIELAWELDTNDRSFQFGRLLAVLERAEMDYYFESGDESRTTTAVKSLSEFRRRPWTTYERINRHLRAAYLPRISEGRQRRYSRLKDEIVLRITELAPDMSELNKSLDDKYLLGYDLQHAEFFKSKDNKTEE